VTARDLPTGTITFMFTDIEGSTRLLEALGQDAFGRSLEAHHEILRRAVANGGVVVRTIGDAFFVVFTDAPAAVAAAATAQLLLDEFEWPNDAELSVRMGLHTGSAVLGGDDYVGLDVHRAARIADAGHGGQVLLSDATAALAGAALPEGVSVRSLGAHRLKDLSEAVPLHQLDIDGHRTDFPPLRTIDAVAGNLPVQLTSFIGRGAEIAGIRELLDRSRLVTLTGPGGTGKTRLSVQAAAEVAQDFGDGAYFVSLETITDPDLMAPAILESLEVTTVSGSIEPEDQLAAYLADKEALLVLDNLEQIQGAGAKVAALLSAAPTVKVIATSRGPLRVGGEQEYPVPPLSTPGPRVGSVADVIAQSEGVELFAERALAVRPDFSLTEVNLAAIAELTTRLDGLPLAIELAASRVRVLTPEAILDRLDNRLLANPAPDLPERQRTIANAIGWSYDLLDEPVRRLFENCSVFMGGASLEFLERVATAGNVDVLDGLSALVDGSLLRLAATEGEPRYQMLVVIREFAYGALVARGDDDRLRERHARAYAALAAEAEPFLLTSRQGEWLDRLAIEHDNLRAALDWAVETGAADLALETVANLWRFWQARGHLAEGAERIEQALSIGGGAPRARAMALEAKGGVLYWLGRWQETLQPYEQALELFREHGDAREIANALYNASFPLGWSGDRDAAHAYLEESLTIAEAAGDRLGVGRAYWGLCDQAKYVDDRQGAIRYATLAEDVFSELDAPYDLGWSRFMLAQAHFELGDYATARRYHAEGLRTFAEVGDQSAMVLFLYLKAGILIGEGDRDTGARIFGGVEELKERSGAAIADVELNQYEPLKELFRGSPDSAIREAIAAGKRLTVDELLALAESS
jgi:predicted ATPase/class 3 adenylate cyclase